MFFLRFFEGAISKCYHTLSTSGLLLLLVFTANAEEPLCVVVLHKKYPKSFVSNFGGSSTRGINMKLKVSRATREVIAMLHR